MALEFHSATVATYRGYRIGLIRTPLALVMTARGPGRVALMEVGAEEEELFRRVVLWIDSHDGREQLAASA